MFISRHEHYLRLKVLRRYFQYISLGQPVCFALIKDGGKNHESAYCENSVRVVSATAGKSAVRPQAVKILSTANIIMQLIH